MTAKAKAYNLCLKFSLLKNDNLEYVADKETVLAAVKIFIEEMIDVTRITPVVYYPEHYWEMGLEYAKDIYNKWDKIKNNEDSNTNL